MALCRSASNSVMAAASADLLLALLLAATAECRPLSRSDSDFAAYDAAATGDIIACRMHAMDAPCNCQP